MNNTAFSKAVIYCSIGDIMLPYLQNPMDCMIECHCIDWIHQFFIFLDHKLKPVLTVMKLQRIDYSLIKRLEKTGTVCWKPLDLDI